MKVSSDAKLTGAFVISFFFSLLVCGFCLAMDATFKRTLGLTMVTFAGGVLVTILSTAASDVRKNATAGPD